MKPETVQRRIDDQTLAAIAVSALAQLAQRMRNSRDYELYAHVRDGAAMLETRLIPDVRTPARAN